MMQAALHWSMMLVVEMLHRLSAHQIKSLIRASDHHRVGRAFRAKRSSLMPLGAIRVGQTRLSFRRIGEKLSKMVALMRGESIERYRDLVREDAISGILGPDARYIVVEDGNHKLAALRALDGLLLTDAAFAPFRVLLSHDADSWIRVRLIDDLSSLSENAFWRRMTRRLFLERLDGTIAERPPASIADVEDDPFRMLAANVRARAKLSKQRVRLTGAEYPLWIKLPGWSPYVEFRVGSVLNATSRRLGTCWDGTRSLTVHEQEACRASLIDAEIPGAVAVAERAHLSTLERRFENRAMA